MQCFEDNSDYRATSLPAQCESFGGDFGGVVDNSFDTIDTIPVDESGFDEDAWMAFLVAESLSDTGTSATPTRADLVADFANIQKQSSRLRAKEQHLLAELSQQARASAGGDSSRVRELAMRSLAAELGATGRLSDRTITSRINMADTMVGRFPATV